MLLSLVVHGTFSISHIVHGFKKRKEGRKRKRERRGGERKKRGWRAGGLRLAEASRRLKTTSWKIFEMELQAYSALL